MDKNLKLNPNPKNGQKFEDGQIPRIDRQKSKIGRTLKNTPNSEIG